MKVMLVYTAYKLFLCKKKIINTESLRLFKIDTTTIPTTTSSIYSIYIEK